MEYIRIVKKNTEESIYSYFYSHEMLVQELSSNVLHVFNLLLYGTNHLIEVED